MSEPNRVSEPPGTTAGDWGHLPSPQEIRLLREKHYNATLIERIDINSELARFRIRPDDAIPSFEPGQYIALGLGNWEPRLADSQQEELPARKVRKVVRRAYSISCPLLDPQKHIAPVDSIDYLEFYVTLVRHADQPDQKPPALTPRLFCLSPGDRLVVAPKITGHYLLGDIRRDETVLMLGTGTGEAPHNAMAAKLLAEGHRGRVVVATSVRYRADLGYMAEHQTLMQQFPQYRYLPLTTREPENLDPDHPDYVGKQYLQKLFLSGELAEMAEDPLRPERTHVFLCGNPAMIGYASPGSEPPSQPGMLPLLLEAGFHQETTGPDAGYVRFEKYW